MYIYLLKNPDIKEGKLISKTSNQNIEITVTELMRPYFLLKDSECQVTTATRVVPMEGPNNFRDLGGYETNDHHHIKWGKLFRSDHLHRITSNDKKILEEIGVKTIIDYRRQDEYSNQPNKIWSTLKKTFHIVPQAERAVIAAKAGGTKEKVRQLVEHEVDQDIKFDNSGKTMIEQARDFVRLYENKKIYRQMIEIVLNEQNIPIDQHCRGGKDRTGYGVAIILYLLGVNIDVIIEDYMLTKTLRSKRNDRRMRQYSNETNDKNVLDYLYSMLDTRSEYLSASFDEMIKESGSIDNYLKNELNVTKSEITLLRSLYLE
ncbi:protein-tyrosine-phosphatase [Bombilactobacillus bombi]|uniref:Protein-tyrosine-phosphatase n=1 Tax=Bombilactobacillus bombi TaxID=1303590 RepID=A0A3R6UXW0_9LACO|nr:tyrosine-protein phosphatase [Bombilactobacillus bombi]RHW50028.1 protein-tyrosine-phosphatase [Bombilactobacillus bombi]